MLFTWHNLNLSYEISNKQRSASRKGQIKRNQRKALALHPDCGARQCSKILHEQQITRIDLTPQVSCLVLICM